LLVALTGCCSASIDPSELALPPEIPAPVDTVQELSDEIADAITADAALFDYFEALVSANVDWMVYGARIRVREAYILGILGILTDEEVAEIVDPILEALGEGGP
jgi:hypothetical protein